MQTLNGVELGGRKILVREDREDRDVKQYNRDNGLEGEVRAVVALLSCSLRP